MLKKIVMASVLSSMLGFTCYETEGTLDLSRQVRDSGVPGASKAARRMMRNLSRENSVENFQQFIWQNPEATSAAANYIVENTAVDGSAVDGNNFARFRQGWDGKVTVPASAVTQNPNGSYSVDFNALNSFVEKSMNAAVRAAKGAQKPGEPGFVTALRNEFIQIEKDSEEANLPGQPVAQARQGLFTQDQVDAEVQRAVTEARQGLFTQGQLDQEVDRARRGMFTQEELDQEVDRARQGMFTQEQVDDMIAQAVAAARQGQN